METPEAFTLERRDRRGKGFLIQAHLCLACVLEFSKYLNLETKSKAGKCSDPSVLEPLPRKAPPERVTGEHGGDEETQGSQDRADRVPEYRLFTFKYQRSQSQSTPEGN